MNYALKLRPEKKFTDKMDLTRFARKNYNDIFREKIATYKTLSEIEVGNLVVKEMDAQIESITSDFIEVKTVINTTNIVDSHHDLHLSKTWNKTVKDNPTSYHLKQHENRFESVISNKAKSYNEESNFNLLGLDKNFATVANLNEFVLNRKTMPFMFDTYVNGGVKQHSVGMNYVDIEIAFYDEDSQKEMDFFEEMKALAVNPEVIDELGYVWVVREARKREGSAVVFGSNSITPTLWVKNYDPSKQISEGAAKGTPTNIAEPTKVTPELEALNRILNKKF
jgi:hypothetical protein